MKFRKKKTQDLELDESLFEYIQPQGGITFKEADVIKVGDGYIRVLHLYQLPKSLDDFWLDEIFDIDETIATIDLHTKDTAEVKKNINTSLAEERARANSAKNFAELYSAQRRQEELTTMYDELTTFKEVVKLVDFRVFVMGRNLVELDERCEKILKEFEGDTYLAASFLNEGKREWESLNEPYSVSHNKPFCAAAQPLMTEQIAFGDPFQYSELIDPQGDLLGFTDIGGVVLFYEFTKTEARKHYNAICCGDMGSGKSTFLKKRFKANAAKGNFLRTFDITGEFKSLTKEFGGKIIGGNNILNPLEILKAGDDDYTSYARHISKVGTFFKCVVPSMNDSILISLQNLLREFYKSLDLIPEKGQITGLPANRYPTLSTFLTFLKEKLNEEKNMEVETKVDERLLIKRAEEISDIQKIVKNLVENYGNMFDGHTSIDNIVDEKIVTFDISMIKDLGNVFVAQMFNILSLCWDNAVQNGSIMKELWDDQMIDERDIVGFLMLIDESPRWVNTKLPKLLELLIIYAREARKYFAGITLSAQSIRDFVPEGENSPNIDLIKTLFELTQYKFIFKQDSSAVELLKKVFNNSLTFSQIEKIPYLTRGETVLSIAGDRSVKFKVWLSKQYEEPLFRGGR
ncbi:MAG: hypothetical protein KH297_04700 [Firmicutes bacterium]|nr:hypothetical protein [Bacillota bacterium]